MFKDEASITISHDTMVEIVRQYFYKHVVGFDADMFVDSVSGKGTQFVITIVERLKEDD